MTHFIPKPHYRIADLLKLDAFETKFNDEKNRKLPLFILKCSDLNNLY